jgi:hypothetical protein
MEAESYSETFIPIYQSTWRHIPEDYRKPQVHISVAFVWKGLRKSTKIPVGIAEI